MLTKIKLWWHKNQLEASYSVLEDLGRITCGNAILSGTMPLCEYSDILSPSKPPNATT